MRLTLLKHKGILLFFFIVLFGYPQLKAETDPAKEITQLCKQYAAIRLHKPYEAIALMQKALDISQHHNFPDSLINIYTYIGNVYQTNKIYPLALEAYFNKLKAAETQKDSNSIAYAYTEIGNTYYAQNVFSISFSYYKKAAEIFRRTGLAQGLSVALNNQALVYMQQKDFTQAIKFLNEGLKEREKIGNFELIAHSNMLLGSTYIVMKQYKMAIKYLEASNKIYLARKEPQNVASNMQLIARINIEQKKYPLALQNFKKALELYELRNIHVYHPDILNQIADIQLRCNQLNEARISCYKALGIARENQTLVDQEQSLQLLSKISVAQNNPAEVIFYLQQLSLVKDTLLQQLNNDHFNKLKATVSTYKEEKENEALQKETNQRRKERNIVIIALFLFIVITWFIIVQMITSRRQQATILQQQKAIAELQLKQSKEESVRLGSELDNRNRELVVKSMAIAQNNERITDIIDELQHIRNDKSNLDKHLGAMISTLRHNVTVESWEEFQLRFEHVHPEFYQKLENRFPDLSSGERKLCALLYLNLSTKEISSITNREAASIDVSRSRLRKKLGLTRDSNLVRFLAELQSPR
jgi:tetratricopeptide (TPR) repeat protein/DNA-binding CsgD family transcriptional regulator